MALTKIQLVCPGYYRPSVALQHSLNTIYFISLVFKIHLRVVVQRVWIDMFGSIYSSPPSLFVLYLHPVWEVMISSELRKITSTR